MTPIAVSISGSDSCGAAGIEGDIKTFSALGAYGAGIVTAVAARNTGGLQGMHEVPSAFVTQQIDAIFGDIAVRAVKIGLLGSAANAEQVADALDRYELTDVVLDPVPLSAVYGAPLDEEATEFLRDLLIPRARIITPNLAEAAHLLETTIAEDEDEVIEQAEALLDLGPRAVLITGTSLRSGEAVDIFHDGTDPVRLAVARVSTANTLGAGAALSAAVTAGLSHGIDLLRSVAHAKAYVTQAITHADALVVGQGRGPIQHFHAIWGKLALFGIEPHHDNDDEASG